MCLHVDGQMISTRLWCEHVDDFFHHRQYRHVFFVQLHQTALHLLRQQEIVEDVDDVFQGVFDLAHYFLVIGAGHCGARDGRDVLVMMTTVDVSGAPLFFCALRMHLTERVL